eukprot:SAG11_NODE_6017_length_1407_cov_37.608098_1_plen_116_part_10
MEILEEKRIDYDEFWKSVGFVDPWEQTLAVEFPQGFRFFQLDTLEESENMASWPGVEECIFNESTKTWEEVETSSSSSSSDSDSESDEEKLVTIKGVPYKQKGNNLHCPDTDELVF